MKPTPFSSTSTLPATQLLLDTPSVPMGTDFRKLTLQPGASGVTDAIIRPDSIVAIQSYALRFIPYMGSAPVLLAIALRQAYYRSSRKDGSSSVAYPGEGDEVTVEVASLLRMLGGVISRAKFFRIFKDEKMDWSVRRAEADHTFESGHIKRLPNTYQFRGNLLTPGDAVDLYHWLRSRLSQHSLVEVLTLAIQTERDQILTFPFRTPSVSDQEFNTSVSVRDVVVKAAGVEKMDSILSSLCDALASHLIRPESFLSVPWYWFRHVLPELGDDMGALYLMSKSCCFVDWSQGKDRDTFWVMGGEGTLQAWIGSSTLPGRIPHKKPSQRGRPREDNVKDNSEYVRSWREDRRNLVGAYIERIATRKSEFGMDWQLKVFDTQLSQKDEILRDAISSLLEANPNNIGLDMLSSFLNKRQLLNLLYRSAVIDKDRGFCHFETLVSAGICHFDTLSIDEIRHFDTLVDALNCHFEIIISQKICHFDTVLNILVRLKNSFFLQNHNLPPHTNRVNAIDRYVFEENLSVVAGNFDKGVWDFRKLSKRINPALRDQLLTRTEVSDFVSWIIYACLTPQITSPLSFAVARTLESGTNAGGPAARLAQLPPADLCEQVRSAKQRLDSGYLGNISYAGDNATELRQFLDGVESKQSQRVLLQRLIDHLGIQSLEEVY